MAKRKKPANTLVSAIEQAVTPQPPPLPETAIPKVSDSIYRIDRWKNAHAPNPAMLRDRLVRDGYTVYQWSDPPGTVYGMHRHETPQTHWIISGELEISVQGGGTCLLGPGDRDTMPANTYHSARVFGDQPVLYLVGELVRYRPR